MEQTLTSTRCEGCDKTWAGHFFNAPFCNDCIKFLPDHDCRTEQGQGCEVCIAWFKQKEKIKESQ
jgi:hypothetical protein